MKRLFVQYLIDTGQLDPKNLHVLTDPSGESHEPIGRLALLHDCINPHDIDRVLEDQRASRELFGRIAVRLKILTPGQLHVLLIGQALRACTEMLEDLALGGQLPMETGARALAEFICTHGFPDNLLETDVAR